MYSSISLVTEGNNVMWNFKLQPLKGNAVSTGPQQEALTSMLGKLSIVWAAFFAGVSLKDALQIAVLIATLLYTSVQTWILIRDKILNRRDRKKKPAQADLFGSQD